MSSTRQPQNARRVGARSLYQYAFFGAFIGGMIFALPTVLLLTLGLLPTLVAFVVDLHPRKYAARSVGFMNFSGTLPFLISLWTGSHEIVSAMQILNDVYAWFVIYSAAALGWLIYLGMPSIAGFIMQIHAVQRVRVLDARRKSSSRNGGRGSTAPEL